MIKPSSKTEMLRARCEPDLKRELRKVAEFHYLDEADIIRRACLDLVRKFKSRADVMAIAE